MSGKEAKQVAVGNGAQGFSTVAVLAETAGGKDDRSLQDGCDLIVCWRHNWPECPLEVLELSEAVKKIGGARDEK